MRFKKHSELEGKHSFLSPSKYAWIRYDDSKIERMFTMHLAALRGTKEHAYAQQAIELGMRQEESKKTINQYINDCIGWRMTPEVALFFSEFCFGHADALGFRANTLRISDYKSGRSKTSFDQLRIYAALFCLIYEMKPFDITIELRIYQSNGVRLEEADAEEIYFYMRRIMSAHKILKRMSDEAKA